MTVEPTVAARTGGPSGTPRPRQAWMDVVPGVAVLLIPLLHAGTLLRHGDLPILVAAGVLAAAPLRSPRRVFSSAPLPRSVDEGSRRYPWGEVGVAVWSFLLWTTGYAVCNWPGRLDPVRWYLPNPLRGGSCLWYVGRPCASYPLAPRRRLLVPLVILLSEVLCDDTKHPERPTHLFALSGLGRWAADRPGRLQVIVGSPRVFSAAALVLGPALLRAPSSGCVPCSVLATLAGPLVVVEVGHRCADQPLRFTGRDLVVFFVGYFPALHVVVHVAPRRGDVPPGDLLLTEAGAAVASLVSRRQPVRSFTAPPLPVWTRGAV